MRKLNWAELTVTPPGRGLLKSNSTYRFDAKVVAQFPVVLTTASAYERESSAVVSETPPEASRPVHAASERMPGKIRFVVYVPGPPFVAELKPASASETVMKDAAAAPARAAQRSARRETGESD